MTKLVVVVFFARPNLRGARSSSSGTASRFLFLLPQRLLLVDLLAQELLKELEFLHRVVHAQRKVAELLVQVPVELFG